MVAYICQFLTDYGLNWERKVQNGKTASRLALFKMKYGGFDGEGPSIWKGLAKMQAVFNHFKTLSWCIWVCDKKKQWDTHTHIHSNIYIYTTHKMKWFHFQRAHLATLCPIQPSLLTPAGILEDWTIGSLQVLYFSTWFVQHITPWKHKPAYQV